MLTEPAYAVPQPTLGEQAFWSEAHTRVVMSLIERDRISFEEALSTKRVAEWLRAQFVKVEPGSFAELHRFAVIAVEATLQQLNDSDSALQDLYTN